MWYEGTSHRYTSPGTKVKVICKGQGQISGSCLAEAIRTTVVPITSLIRTTVVLLSPTIRTTVNGLLTVL